MILTVGDTHGDIDYRKLSNHLVVREFGRLPDFIIQLGDFAVPWSNNPEDSQDRYLRDWYGEKPYDIVVVPGNHECYTRIEKMPREIYHGAWVRRYSKNIVYAERNQILTIEDKTFYCFGGADSTDKQSRVLYQTWWPQEACTYQDFTDAKDLFKRVKSVDYVVTHTAPEKIIAEFNYPERMDGTSKLLTYVDENLEFKHWYFGHMHADKTYQEKYTCQYRKIRLIGESS
jgi:predicted phosphodiesterase